MDFVKQDREVVYSTADEEMYEEERKLQQRQEFIDEMERENKRSREIYGKYLEWV